MKIGEIFFIHDKIPSFLSSPTNLSILRNKYKNKRRLASIDIANDNLKTIQMSNHFIDCCSKTAHRKNDPYELCRLILSVLNLMLH